MSHEYELYLLNTFELNTQNKAKQGAEGRLVGRCDIKTLCKRIPTHA